MMRTSRKPCVVIRPVFAPLRSSTALVATVVACRTTSTALPRTSISASSFSNPSITASPGLAGLVGTFRAWVAPVASSDSTKSVNVPPMSNATRIMRRWLPGLLTPSLDGLGRQFTMRRIERATEPGQYLVDLRLRDDERRRERNPVADDPQHQAVLVP